MAGCMYRNFTAVKRNTEGGTVWTWTWLGRDYRCRSFEDFRAWVDMVIEGRTAPEMKEEQ